MAFCPTDDSIPGFSNRWYRDALRQAESVDLDGTRIRVLTFPYFVATKLEAFEGRGNGDYLGSKDIEDLVAVFAGRPTFLRELAGVTGDLGCFIREKFAAHLATRDFAIALDANLPRDANVSAQRIVADLRELSDDG